jgi:hypothetical protein
MTAPNYTLDFLKLVRPLSLIKYVVRLQSTQVHANVSWQSHKVDIVHTWVYKVMKTRVTFFLFELSVLESKDSNTFICNLQEQEQNKVSVYMILCYQLSKQKSVFLNKLSRFCASNFRDLRLIFLRWNELDINEIVLLHFNDLIINYNSDYMIFQNIKMNATTFDNLFTSSTYI